MKYEVYADGKWHGEHWGLIAACTSARSSAVARPGVEFEVERDGRKEARYLAGAGGKLKTAWMR